MTTVNAAAPRRIAVVGGGIAGLAAAHHLARQGARVVLFEPTHLGGKLRTSPFAGRPVDEGADAFLVRVPWARDLATALGLGDRLVAPATGRAHVFVDGRLQPLPAAHLLGVPTDPDAADVAELLGTAGVAHLRADLMQPGPPPGDDEAVGPFLRRRLGPEVLDRLVGPLVGGINAGDVERMSLAAVTPQLDAAARAPERSFVAACAAQRNRALAAATDPPAPVFQAPLGGMATLVDALVAALVAQGVEIRRGVAVRALEPRQPSGWLVVTDPATGGVATDPTPPEPVDAVIVAAPSPVAAQLLADHAPPASELLGGIRWASVALVTLAVQPDALGTPLDGSGFLVPRAAGLLLTACSWSSSKWAALAPEAGDGTVLLRASAGRDDDRRISELDDADLVERLCSDLATTMGLQDAPRAARVSRWPSSFPQYDVDHLARIDAIEADLALRAPTLAVAGCALRGVGIPASIRSGQLAAERVLAGA